MALNGNGNGQNDGVLQILAVCGSQSNGDGGLAGGNTGNGAVGNGGDAIVGAAPGNGAVIQRHILAGHGHGAVEHQSAAGLDHADGRGEGKDDLITVAGAGAAVQGHAVVAAVGTGAEQLGAAVAQVCAAAGGIAEDILGAGAGDVNRLAGTDGIIAAGAQIDVGTVVLHIVVIAAGEGDGPGQSGIIGQGDGVVADGDSGVLVHTVVVLQGLSTVNNQVLFTAVNAVAVQGVNHIANQVGSAGVHGQLFLGLRRLGGLGLSNLRLSYLGLGHFRLGGNGFGGLGLFLSLVHILQQLSVEHDEGADALAFVVIESGVGTGGNTLEADVLQGGTAELLSADAVKGQDCHICIALIQPAVVDGLHDSVAHQGGAGGLVGVGGGLGGIHVVQPHAVGAVLAGAHAVHQLLQLNLHGLQIGTVHMVHDVNDGCCVPADGTEPVGAGVGGGRVGGMVEQLLGAVVHVIADPLHTADDQVQLFGVADVLGILSPEGQDHVQAVQPQVGAGIGSPGMPEVIAGILQQVAAGGLIQVCIQSSGHGQVALIAGHPVAVHQQAGSLVAVGAVGGIIAGCLLGAVVGAGCPATGSGDHAGHVLNHIVLIHTLAGNLVDILNALEDDAVVVAPVKEVGLAVFTLFVIPGKVGLEILDHSSGIIAGIIDGNTIDVGFRLCQGGGQGSIGFCCECVGRHHADYHNQSQDKSQDTLGKLH